MNIDNFKLLRIGYYITVSKASKLGWDKFEDYAKSQGHIIVLLDFTKPLEDQGPFDVLIHKITDELSEGIDHQAIKLEQYMKNHKHITIEIDPVASQKLVTDRTLFLNSVPSISGWENPKYITAEHYNSSKINELHFPILSKPIRACGTPDSHKMSVVFDREALKTLQFPCILQEYINHGAVVYKIFVLGDVVHCVARPSLRSLHATSGKIDFCLYEAIKVLPQELDPALEVGIPPPPPSIEFLKQMAKAISNSLNMSLFGYDVIVSSLTGKPGVIDINYFPTYKGVPNFEKELIHLIQQKLNKNKLTIW